MTTLTERTVTETVTLPAGTYFIGDPCHVLSRSNIKWPSRDQSNGPWQIQDMPAALFEAYGGDGVRRDCEEYRYEVESGHIAVIPAALITEPLPSQDGQPAGRIMEFKEPFTCRSILYETPGPRRTGCRNIHVGHMTVHT